MIVQHEWEKRVKKFSSRYMQILELNSVFHFYTFQEKQAVNIFCNSKSQFDRYSADTYLTNTLRDSRDNLENYYFQAMFNREQYQTYKQNLSEIFPTSERAIKCSKISSRLLHKVEDSLCATTELHPVLNPVIVLKVCYISEKGRKRYFKNCNVSVEQIRFALSTANKRTAYEDYQKYQRSLMTDSLRYNILRRDHFRCTICGASADEGAKLEVDHIKPISKGGKTEPSNLRTLCRSCNRGKSDKYDPQGIN